MDPTRPAHEVWELHRKPVDIVGRLMIRVDFRLRGGDVTVHHVMCKSPEEADQLCAELHQDMNVMLDGHFRRKHRIAHDLLGRL